MVKKIFISRSFDFFKQSIFSSFVKFLVMQKYVSPVIFFFRHKSFADFAFDSSVFVHVSPMIIQMNDFTKYRIAQSASKLTNSSMSYVYVSFQFCIGIVFLQTCFPVDFMITDKFSFLVKTKKSRNFVQKFNLSIKKSFQITLSCGTSDVLLLNGKSDTQWGQNDKISCVDTTHSM